MQPNEKGDREGIVVARDLYGTGLQRALEAQFE